MTTREKVLAALGGAATILLLAVLFISGCGSASANGGAQLSQDTYAKIENGMAASALKSLAGEPQRTETKSMGGGHQMADGGQMGSSMAVENWYYQGSKGWVRIELSDGKVTNKSGY